MAKTLCLYVNPTLQNSSEISSAETNLDRRAMPPEPSPGTHRAELPLRRRTVEDEACAARGGREPCRTFGAIGDRFRTFGRFTPIVLRPPQRISDVADIIHSDDVIMHIDGNTGD